MRAFHRFLEFIFAFVVLVLAIVQAVDYGAADVLVYEAVVGALSLIAIIVAAIYDHHSPRHHILPAAVDFVEMGLWLGGWVWVYLQYWCVSLRGCRMAVWMLILSFCEFILFMVNFAEDVSLVA
ncbi:hypothetical protein DICA3_E18778 [Diutina catenulata]